MAEAITLHIDGMTCDWCTAHVRVRAGKGDRRAIGASVLFDGHIAETWGGAGASLAYQLVVQDEMTRAEMRATTTTVHSIATHYILDYGTEAQKQRWLPKLVSGEMLAAIAMTEPGCGSDLKAIATRARPITALF